MKVTLTTILRVLLFVVMATMVSYMVTLRQKVMLMERGYEDGFDVAIGPPIYGTLFLITGITLIAVNLVDIWKIRKKKAIRIEDYLLPEYDASDERARDITGRSVKFAFVAILVYSFLALSSYIYIPEYFLDYMWYPMVITASIPIVGLLVYYASYQVLVRR